MKSSHVSKFKFISSYNGSRNVARFYRTECSLSLTNKSSFCVQHLFDHNNKLFLTDVLYESPKIVTHKVQRLKKSIRAVNIFIFIERVVNDIKFNNFIN